MLFSALVRGLTVRTKGKGEDTVRVARLVLEVEDPDDWKLDAMSEAMNGVHHDIAIDEEIRR